MNVITKLSAGTLSDADISVTLVDKEVVPGRSSFPKAVCNTVTLPAVNSDVTVTITCTRDYFTNDVSVHAVGKSGKITICKVKMELL